MSMNSIADGAATFKLPAFNNTVPVKQSVKDTAETVVASKVQDASPKPPEADKVPLQASAADKSPARGMSHVVESYDSKGKVLTKYMDSSNNVIYQTPSEMVLKTQELMTNTQATTNIKG